MVAKKGSAKGLRRSDEEDVSKEVATTAPKRKKVKAPKRENGREEEAEDNADAEENPGLLLADFVAASPAGTGSKASRKKAPIKKPSKAKAEKKATEADEDLLSLMMPPDFGFDDEDDATSAGRLARHMGRLGEGETPALLSAKRRLEARAESEFHTGSVGEVTVEDLLEPLVEAPSFGDVRRQLQSLTRKEALAGPASDVKRTREERTLQYEASAKDARKWVPQIQRMRRSDQVMLGPELTFVDTTEELAGNFEATDDFEKELEAVTRAAGATEEDLKGAKMLPMHPRLRQDAETRQVARLKALLMREQQSSRRIKKIKSKTYRRIHRKGETKDREVMLERLEIENPELAKALKQDYEKKHAVMRLQRQKNARKKWAQTMQRFAKGDRGAQQEITQQAQKAHDEQKALRRAIRGQDPNQSSDSEAVDLSGSDDDGGQQGLARQTLAKAKKLTLQEIRNNAAGDGDLPTTGIMGLSFMREAIKRKRENAKKEAEQVLKELEGMGDTLDKDDYDASEDEAQDRKRTEAAKAKATKAAKVFTEEELAKARDQVDELLQQEDNAVECTVSGPLTIRGMKAATSTVQAKSKKAPISSSEKPAPATSSVSAPASTSTPSSPSAPKLPESENPWLSLSTVGSEGVAEKESKEVKASKKKKRISKASRPSKADSEDDEAAAAMSYEDPLSALNADSEEAKAQRELVRTAFVEGNQEEDFLNEEEEKERKKQEKEQLANAGLAGWGHWTGEGMAPPKPKKSKIGAVEAKPRKPSLVTKYEGSAPQSAKFFSDKVPYGFQNAAQYDQQLRMPSGPEWNSLPAHLNKIKPKIFMKVGAIVPPLQYVKHLPEESRDGVIDKWAAAKQPKRLKARI